jgi:hypothetical protein
MIMNGESVVIWKEEVYTGVHLETTEENTGYLRQDSNRVTPTHKSRTSPLHLLGKYASSYEMESIMSVRERSLFKVYLPALTS